jgi:hypothetical protein
VAKLFLVSTITNQDFNQTNIFRCADDSPTCGALPNEHLKAVINQLISKKSQLAGNKFLSSYPHE